MTINKSKVAQRFSLSAHQYDQLAGVQNRIGDQLLQQLPQDLSGQLIDLGCGTGRTLRALETMALANLKSTGIDMAAGMLEVAAKRTSARLVQGDLESMPFPQASFDIAISNLAFQWCNAETVFRETHRILKPSSPLIFTTFGPGTLQQLRSTLFRVQPELQHRVHRFAAADELTQQLGECGFTQIQISPKLIHETFPNVKEMLKSVRRLGAGFAGDNVNSFGKARYNQFLAQLESCRTNKGELQLTYETYFVSCRSSS